MKSIFQHHMAYKFFLMNKKRVYIILFNFFSIWQLWWRKSLCRNYTT